MTYILFCDDRIPDVIFELILTYFSMNELSRYLTINKHMYNRLNKTQNDLILFKRDNKQLVEEYAITYQNILSNKNINNRVYLKEKYDRLIELKQKFLTIDKFIKLLGGEKRFCSFPLIQLAEDYGDISLVEDCKVQAFEGGFARAYNEYFDYTYVIFKLFLVMDDKTTEDELKLTNIQSITQEEFETLDQLPQYTDNESVNDYNELDLRNKILSLNIILKLNSEQTFLQKQAMKYLSNYKSFKAEFTDYSNNEKAYQYYWLR